MVLVKNKEFFHPFILNKIGQESVFHDISVRKSAFLDYKNKTLKNSKKMGFF